MADWKNPRFTDDQHLTILGLGMASPGYWAEVVNLQKERVWSWQDALGNYLEGALGGSRMPDMDGQDARIAIPHMIGIEAHYLIYAADRVLTICRRYQSLSGNDPQFSGAVSAFDNRSDGLSSVRDWLAHFEDYAIGTGRESVGTQQDGPHIEFDDADARGEVIFRIGTRALRIHALADATRSLAAAADRFWDDRIIRR
jgi:hypothetical protein